MAFLRRWSKSSTTEYRPDVLWRSPRKHRERQSIKIVLKLTSNSLEILGEYTDLIAFTVTTSTISNLIEWICLNFDYVTGELSWMKSTSFENILPKTTLHNSGIIIFYQFRSDGCAFCKKKMQHAFEKWFDYDCKKAKFGSFFCIVFNHIPWLNVSNIPNRLLYNNFSKLHLQSSCNKDWEDVCNCNAI